METRKVAKFTNVMVGENGGDYVVRYRGEDGSEGQIIAPFEQGDWLGKATTQLMRQAAGWAEESGYGVRVVVPPGTVTVEHLRTGALDDGYVLIELVASEVTHGFRLTPEDADELARRLSESASQVRQQRRPS